jgi:hypothetical protein
MYKPVSVEEALAALPADNQQGMGRVSGGMGSDATDRLAALDACAHSYRAWSPILIPGLLQTSRYTYGAIRSRTPSLPSDEIVRRVRHRVRRTESFLGHWAGRTGSFAWFVMGEAAITQPVIDDYAHGHQLMHILNISRNYPSLMIQVLPEVPNAPLSVEPFSWFALEDGSRVGHLETLLGGWYSTVTEDVSRLHQTFSDMIQTAYTPSRSREFIQEVLETCWGHMPESSSASRATATPTTASTLPALPAGPSQ